MSNPMITENDFTSRKISIYEPFSDFLLGSEPEKRFDLTLLDAVRFAGHACPSMIGAFLVAQKAVKALFPENGVCVRGEVEIEIPSASTQGPTGPIANVFGLIFGAWGETGFGGLQGQFARRGLLRFCVSEVPQGAFRFRNRKTGVAIDVFYSPAMAPFEADPQEDFQKQWRRKIKAIVDNADVVVKTQVVAPQDAVTP